MKWATMAQINNSPPTGPELAAIRSTEEEAVNETLMDNATAQAVSWIEAAGKGTALLLGTIYGAGFLIVSIHHAKYGIVEFSALKPRVFLAGAIFVFLVAIAAVVAFRNFGYRNFSRSYPLLDAPVSQDPTKRTYVIAIRAILFYIPSRYVPVAFGFLFNFQQSSSG